MYWMVVVLLFVTASCCAWRIKIQNEVPSREMPPQPLSNKQRACRCYKKKKTGITKMLRFFYACLPALVRTSGMARSWYSA
jgi:hypothetical protein